MAWNMQVLGNAKGVVAAIISVAIFKNPVTTAGAMGYLITVGGVVAYSQVRIHAPAPIATLVLASWSGNCYMASVKIYGRTGRPLWVLPTQARPSGLVRKQQASGQGLFLGLLMLS